MKTFPQKYSYRPAKSAIITSALTMLFFSGLSLFASFSVEHDLAQKGFAVGAFCLFVGALAYAKVGFEAACGSAELIIEEERLFLPQGLGYKRSTRIDFCNVKSFKVKKMKTLHCLILETKNSTYFINEALLTKEEFSAVQNYLTESLGQ